jgi:hypothetical protein
MKVKKTAILDFNYRQAVLPPMTEEQYLSLQAGDAVELDDDAAKLLLDQSLVTQEN